MKLQPFATWWTHVGSGVRPLTGANHEEHACMMASLAWHACMTDMLRQLVVLRHVSLDGLPQPGRGVLLLLESDDPETGAYSDKVAKWLLDSRPEPQPPELTDAWVYLDELVEMLRAAPRDGRATTPPLPGPESERPTQ